MQPTQQATGNNLQGSASTLQQQDTATQYQQTGGVGQDALGPEQYRSFDSLSVQGSPAGSTTTSVTAGTNSPEVILLVIVLVIAAGVLLARKYIFKTSAVAEPHESLDIIEQTTSVEVPQTTSVEVPQTTTKPKKKKSAKKTASKVKNPTKKSKKSGKK
jgi:hypothetical protein